MNRAGLLVELLVASARHAFLGARIFACQRSIDAHSVIDVSCGSRQGRGGLRGGEGGDYGVRQLPEESKAVPRARCQDSQRSHPHRCEHSDSCGENTCNPHKSKTKETWVLRSGHVTALRSGHPLFSGGFRSKCSSGPDLPRVCGLPKKARIHQICRNVGLWFQARRVQEKHCWRRRRRERRTFHLSRCQDLSFLRCSWASDLPE